MVGVDPYAVKGDEGEEDDGVGEGRVKGEELGGSMEVEDFDRAEECGVQIVKEVSGNFGGIYFLFVGRADTADVGSVCLAEEDPSDHLEDATRDGNDPEGPSP